MNNISAVFGTQKAWYPLQSLIIYRTINTPWVDNSDQLRQVTGLLNLLRLGHCLSRLYNRTAWTGLQAYQVIVPWQQIRALINGELKFCLYGNRAHLGRWHFAWYHTDLKHSRPHSETRGHRAITYFLQWPRYKNDQITKCNLDTRQCIDRIHTKIFLITWVKKSSLKLWQTISGTYATSLLYYLIDMKDEKSYQDEACTVCWLYDCDFIINFPRQFLLIFAKKRKLFVCPSYYYECVEDWGILQQI